MCSTAVHGTFCNLILVYSEGTFSPRLTVLTRAQIRAPLDCDIMSHETRFSDTVDNVKAKTQDEED
jgi:hypothetical protein